MRSLSAEEAALWARVAATIKPLSRETPGGQAAPNKPEIRQANQPPKPSPARRAKSAPTAQVRLSTTLDGSWDKKLSGGSVSPDRVLDLHGMDLDRAWTAIDQTLEQAIGAGERVILLITGHARSGGPSVQRGRIRAAVHDWLAASRHASKIAAVRDAHRRHGGGGSLYIILRRGARP